MLRIKELCLTLAGIARVMSLVLLVAVCLPGAAWGWGRSGHEWITVQAIDLLPDTAAGFYRHYRYDILNGVMDPDIRKRRIPSEGMRHYLDIEDYVRWGMDMDSIPWSYAAVVAKVGEDRLRDYGTVPWAIVETYNNLTRALNQGNMPEAIRWAADLAHYVGDAHQPLHTTTNYDGQLTGNGGVHMRYEIEMFNEHSHELPAAAGDVITIDDPLAYTFDEIVKTHQLVDAIMAADAKATWEPGLYDDHYYRIMWGELRDQLIQTTRAGAVALASYYYTAAAHSQGWSPAVVAALEAEERAAAAAAATEEPPRSAGSKLLLLVIAGGIGVLLWWLMRRRNTE